MYAAASLLPPVRQIYVCVNIGGHVVFFDAHQEDKLWDIPASLLKERKKVAVSKDLLKALLKVVSAIYTKFICRFVRRSCAD